MKRLELKGIIPATVLPMDRHFRIDEFSLKRYIAWLTGFGKLGGVAVNADTGEGPHLSQEERLRVVKIYRRELKGRMPIISGLSARCTEEAVKCGKELIRAGADALLVFPIGAFMGQPLDWKVPYNYYKSLSDGINAPLVAFQLQPGLGGALFNEETILKILSVKNVIALKEASFDAVTYCSTRAAMKKAGRKVFFLTGNDNFIYESFLLGAEGALIGFGTILIREQIDMYNAAMRKDFALGEKLNEKVSGLADFIFAAPARDYRVRLKEALKILKVIRNSYIRPPLLPLENGEKAGLKNALKTAGLVRI